MNPTLAARIEGLSELGEAGALARGLKGLEKESLRVTNNGNLARTEHPRALGSALTHRFITTDYSEALMELVTPPLPTARETVACLSDIHQWVYPKLGDELLWPLSMPCRVTSDEDVPVAWYGTSNVGQMKRVYRIGLGHRYGRLMQTISGVHYNYSLPEEFWPVLQQSLGNEDPLDAFVSARYLGLVRNFRRIGWLVLYLYGASPALCQSFLGNREHRLDDFGNGTLYLPYATSMRMSDLGYSNNVQSRLNISANSLEEYTDGLESAITTPWPDYERIGVVVNGEYRQLNANLLQIENEYYSSVRPKRVAMSGERPTAALRRGGIEYVEIRSLDINLFDPCGVNQNSMRFIEAFLIYCLLQESPELKADELRDSAHNQVATAKHGRDPDLRLQRSGEQIAVKTWASEIVTNVLAVAAELDRHDGNNSYAEAVTEMQRLVDDPEATPSARILRELTESGAGFFEFALDLAKSHRDYFASIAEPNRAADEEYRREAAESLQRQAEIEVSDDIDLDTYLDQYFNA